MRTFVTSDSHFYHKNIIKYSAARKKKWPHLDEEKMVEDMIYLHNSIVGEDDFVINLGDFLFAPVARGPEVLSRLNGKHILIRGNHDKGFESMMKMGFTYVAEQMLINVRGTKIICQHRPYYEKLPKKVYGVFHGHTHDLPVENLIRAEEDPDIPAFNVNVCVENTKFKPILVEDALGRLNNQLRNAGWWPWRGGPDPLVKQ